MRATVFRPTRTANQRWHNALRTLYHITISFTTTKLNGGCISEKPGGKRTAISLVIRGKTKYNEVKISFAVYKVKRQLKGTILCRDVRHYMETPDISQYPKLF